jgi:hypothetical protein
MLLNCANPNCSAEFLYLYEGELFLIELPNRTVERYWLCRDCSLFMGVIYDASQGARIVPRDIPRKSVHSRTVA